MEREDDVQLIRKILSGDDAAFSILVERHQKSVHALAWRKLQDFHYAEEIMQDTFLKAYKKLPTLKNPNQFAGWLHVIANRLCIDWVRKQKPVIQSLEDTRQVEIEDSSYTHYMSKQRVTERTEYCQELVKRLLEKLPENERKVVTLYYLDEMSTKEIGEFMGVSVNTITSRLQRARKRLQTDQELLDQEFFGHFQLSDNLKENIMSQLEQLRSKFDAFVEQVKSDPASRADIFQEASNRAGADLRYEVTPQLRLIGTANPDFDNIEQVVEGIDFSYGERYVEDRRPFFSEGGNVYSVGGLLHSRRIEDMDAGLKLFGKIGKNTSVGTLGTYHRNNQNFILQASQSLTATSSISTAFLSHHRRDNAANNVVHLSGDVRHSKISAASTLTQSWAGQSDGREGNASLRYNGSLFEPEVAVFFVDPDFVNNLGYQPFTGYRGGYVQGSIRNEWREGFIRSVYLWAGALASNTYEGEVFRRNLSTFLHLLTHSDYRLAISWDGGQFEEFTDSVFSIGLSARASDQFNNASVNYTWGEQAGERIHRISGNLNLRAYGFTAGLSSRIQWHFEKRYQQILTFASDFSPALSLGSRLIWQVEGINIYFALRRSGYAGTDFFIILGDPNALEFKRRLVAKVIRSF